MKDDNKIDWPKLRYHPVHSALWNYNGRFAAVVAGRQSGKTELCLRKLVMQLPIIKPYPDPLYFFLYPTYQQAKQKIWDRTLRLIPKNWILKNGINIQDMTIRTIFGSKLTIAGADKPHRLEGSPADWIMVDESADQRPNLYGVSLRPMLGIRNGACWRLGVPKRAGIGRMEYREFFNKGLKGEDGIRSFYWKTSEIWSKEEIEAAKKQSTELDFKEQYEAEWIDQGSTVYYAFGDDNVRDDIYYDPTQEIVVGCDFNVNPMCWVLSHYRDGKLFVFDEMFIRDANTQDTLDKLFSKYRDHLAGWRFYGDASSRARKTSALRSDYLIIKNDARFGQKKVNFPRRNPHVRDRVACVNKALKNASGDVHLLINYTCKKLINDLTCVQYEEGTSEIEDYHGTDIGHMVDAFGYIVHQLMPIKLVSPIAPMVYLSSGQESAA